MALHLALVVATEAVCLLITPPLATLAELHAGSQPWGALPLAPLVVGGCAAALAACWAWLVACAVVVTVGAMQGVRNVRGCPRLVRALVLATLGVAVSTGPATADSAGAGLGAEARQARDADSTSRNRPGVLGLPVPDRVVTPASTRVTAQATSLPRVARVRPGDSLWAIAERHLPVGAPDAAVEAGWRLLAAANADRIGHPDLIFPGTVLRVPPLDGTHRSTH
ncbi:MAG: LysM peptidoglycan-binding domain-containing protein [Nocardioides sp.]